MLKKQTLNNLPLISIIMPCFNSERYIEQAIKSVVTQEYSKMELFIKDGGSTDKTVKVIKKYKKKYPKIIKWISAKDKGQSDALNYGIKKTRGEIVGYLNSDDLYKQGALKTVVKAFQDNQNSEWLIGRSDIVDENNKVIRRLITAYKNLWLNFYSYKTLLIVNYIPQMSVFWRRKIIKEVGFFDPKQFYVMDYDYWLRLGKRYVPLIIKDYLSSFRIISTSKSTIGYIKQFSDEYKAAKKNTNSKLLLNLHAIHIRMITSIYKLIN